MPSFLGRGVAYHSPTLFIRELMGKALEPEVFGGLTEEQQAEIGQAAAFGNRCHELAIGADAVLGELLVKYTGDPLAPVRILAWQPPNSDM